jgi:hypothetical protein
MGFFRSDGALLAEKDRLEDIHGCPGQGKLENSGSQEFFGDLQPGACASSVREPLSVKNPPVVVLLPDDRMICGDHGGWCVRLSVC